MIIMSREYDLKPAPSGEDSSAKAVGDSLINRRQFLSYGFNTATGVLAASLGVLGFASLLLPPGGSGGGDLAAKYWAKGREDEAWYGAMHEQVMKKSDFVAEAAKSSTGTSGAAGVWNGVPIVVTYVDHSKNAGSPVSNGKARFQFMDGYATTNISFNGVTCNHLT